MDWEIMGPMMVAVVFILTTGGVILFRPLTKRLGDLIEVIRERRELAPTDGIEELRETVERQSSRISVLERRLDFTESLLGARAHGDLEPASPPRTLAPDISEVEPARPLPPPANRS